MRIRILLCLLLAAANPASAAESTVDWQPWSKESFAKAGREHKQVFLYLEAVWCHWCHVTQQQTLSDPAVLEKLREHYVAIRVDHDADPLLAMRYREWGWPALIFLAPDGSEIVKRAGYIGPEPFARLLDAITDDPSPEQETSSPVAARQDDGAGSLSETQRSTLRSAYRRNLDRTLGGLRTPQKFLDLQSLEYSMRLAAVGDDAERQQVQLTLDAARALIDPVWGGVYQYSTGSIWTQPHYEKLMRVQARYLRLYTQAYILWRRESDRRAAVLIRNYLFGFLRDSASGAFYVSQDADVARGTKATSFFALNDAGRRRQGVPRLDRHLYSDANGQAIEALALYADAFADADALAAAVKAAEWALAHRSLPGGGFRHDAHDKGGPYLSDTLALAKGFLSLYRSTGARRWLAHAQEASAFIAKAFTANTGGYYSAVQGGSPLAPVLDLEQNVVAARHFNLLAQYSGSASDRAAALHGMRWLSQPAVSGQNFEEAGILLADAEIATAPPHLTVVGGKRDAVAAGLYAAARAGTPGYARLEWWDRTEGPLANADVPYPDFPRPAGYVCGNKSCSAPSFSAVEYRKRLVLATGADPS